MGFCSDGILVGSGGSWRGKVMEVVFFFLQSPSFSQSSLFLSSHISLSRSRLALELGWVHGLIWAWWWDGIG